jgi:hypothetical protein
MRYYFKPHAATATDNIADRYGGGELTPVSTSIGTLVTKPSTHTLSLCSESTRTPAGPQKAPRVHTHKGTWTIPLREAITREQAIALREQVRSEAPACDVAAIERLITERWAGIGTPKEAR